jgi:hypothetical protein
MLRPLNVSAQAPESPHKTTATIMAKRKRRLTAAEKREKKRRRREFMTIFMNGKQKRVRRPPTIEGMDVDEFIRRNADPTWLVQNEQWDDLEFPELTIRLDRCLRDQLYDLAARQGRDFYTVIANALQHYIHQMTLEDLAQGQAAFAAEREIEQSREER